MTAIAFVYTPDGFVIGADGRRRNPDGTIESDDTTKIAEYSAANIRAVGAWSGIPKFAIGNAVFDVKTQTIEIAESIKEQDFPTLLDYAGTITWSIYSRFLEWLKQPGRVIRPDLTELAVCCCWDTCQVHPRRRRSTSWPNEAY
jgi:hypothetical protein